MNRRQFNELFPRDIDTRRKVERGARVREEFLTASSPVILWTNGGELYRVYRDTQPSYVIAVLFEDDKKTREHLKRFAITRIKEGTSISVRLFVEGFKLKEEEATRFKNASIQVIKVES